MYNIYLSSLRFRPLTSFRVLDISLIHFSILTSGNIHCKIYILSIKYMKCVMITYKPPKLTKESILVSWWTIFGWDKPYLSNKVFQKSFCFFNKRSSTQQTLKPLEPHLTAHSSWGTKLAWPERGLITAYYSELPKSSIIWQGMLTYNRLLPILTSTMETC